MRRLAAVLALIILAAACSDDAGTPAPTGSPTVSPTPTPAATTNVRSGSANAKVTGDESFEVEIPLVAADSQYNPPPAGFAFVFKDERDNLITIGGEAFEGSRKTAGTLAFGVVFNREGRVIAHTDTTGGCDLTMKRSGKAVTGSFTCGNLENGRYKAEGTFAVELV